MQAICLVLALGLLLTSCAPGGPPAGPAGKEVGANLTAGQKAAIGKKIWQNECAGTVAGLTTWNAGEEFPSLGIGHFIWYPAGFKGRFEESWPSFVAFARKRGVNLPSVAAEAHSPWRTKADFQKDFQSSRMKELRSFLAANVTLQTDFIIARSHAALPKILAAAPPSEKARIGANYYKVATTSQGTYALIDYVNFKGEGTQVSERYKGYGWGLLQVLGGMKDTGGGAASATEFAESAKRVLSRRIDNSPPDRGEKRWKEGWHSRCATYGRPL
ncbi:MAG: hypothetical protein EOP87_12040 [Verrucomicrobiaceae bacterium]|nr:MAG: hypothetical protein EOP87_12040 [Verrucomicrobiaceae bacterium]